ncbi:hypothetical protein ACFQH3_13775 [Haladaptatus sp. GCM10025707]|uniref:hypothetical protein n=1 Tax=unclassified Haladaptatus TaxID=2622732 RepID=UPI0023E7E0AF|nr:hypothetical protein [Haladaptatus sp. QDMS2]
MSSDIAYDSVAVPEQKAPTAYTYVERRADLLQRIREAGHPRALNQTELAKRYGVSQQQISKDLDRLAAYVNEHLGESHQFVMDSVLQGAMLNLIEDGEHYRAAQVARWWAEWLGEVGAIETEPEKHSIEHSAGEGLGSGLSEEELAALDAITSTSGTEATDVPVQSNESRDVT